MARKKTTAETPAMKRVKWLLEHHYGGSQAEMSRQTKVSMTGIAKVVSGQQDPGRRLLETIVGNTKVSPAWLYAGEGPVLRGSGIPVATTCLPGSPAEYREQFGDELVTEVANLYSPMRYWLKLRSTEPAVTVGGTNLVEGDMLLMDADPSLFATTDALDGRWCVVRVPALKGFKPRLARLEYFSGGGEGERPHLEAETFEHHPMVGQRTVIDEFPSGERKVTVHKVHYEQTAAGKAEKGDGLKAWESSILPRGVEVADIIAVCVLMVRRFG